MYKTQAVIVWINDRVSSLIRTIKSMQNTMYIRNERITGLSFILTIKCWESRWAVKYDLMHTIW